jgi:hypothetical protein
MKGSDDRSQAILSFVIAACILTVICVGGLIALSPVEGVWRDTTWLAQAQAVSGGLGAVIAGLALFYAAIVAARQFKMMEDQGKITDRQVDLMGEQRDISRRIETASSQQALILQQQAEMIQRQREIAETQHTILMKQIGERGKLFLVFEPWEAHQNEQVVVFNIDLYIRNDGWLRVDDCTWSVFGQMEDVLLNHWAEATSQLATRIDGLTIEGYHRTGWSGTMAGGINRGQFRRVGTVRVRKAFIRKGPLKFWWLISTTEQRFPEGDKPGEVEIALKDFRQKYQ